jgi:hypothetical protein
MLCKPYDINSDTMAYWLTWRMAAIPPANAPTGAGGKRL